MARGGASGEVVWMVPLRRDGGKRCGNEGGVSQRSGARNDVRPAASGEALQWISLWFCKAPLG